MEQQPGSTTKGLHALGVLCVILHALGTSTHVDAGLYLPKRDYNFFVDDVTSLPLDTTTIGILHLSEHPVFPCDVTQYEITPNASGSVRLRLDAKRIELRVEPDSLPGTISSAKGFSFEIRLVCKDANHESLQPYYEPLTRAKVSLRSIPPGLAKLKALDPSSVGNGAPFSGTDVMEEILDAIRPRGGHLGYDLVENTSEGSILDVLDLGSWLGDIASVELNVSADEEFLSLSQRGSRTVVSLAYSPDREVSSTLSAMVTCRVKLRGHSDEITKAVEVKATVYDVDDQPPSASGRKIQQLKERTIDRDKTSMRLVVDDKDSPATTNNKTYRITTNDTTGAVQIGDTTFRRFIFTNVKLSLSQVKLPFTADVYFDDTTYMAAPGEDVFDKRVIYRLRLVGDGKEPTPRRLNSLTATVDKAATNFSIIKDVSDEADVANVTFQLEQTDVEGLANVTSQGLLYLVDSRRIWGIQKYSMSLHIGKYEGDRKVGKFRVLIRITNDDHRRTHFTCDDSCSTHNTSDTCEKSCGLGAPSGFCTWSSGQMTSLTNQKTCSPDLRTCPDNVCDDVEQMDWAICPQDCDIDAGAMRSLPTRTGPVRRSRSSHGCNHACRVTVVVIASCVIVVYLVVFVTWLVHRRRRKQRRHLTSLKRSNSLVSVGAVPSDYIVGDSHSRGEGRGHAVPGGQRQVTTSSSPSSGYWGSSDTGPNLDIFDETWEFPRSNLTLDHILGEGEFGQVVKAKAYNLNDQGLNTVVAVKMLKPEATGAEYQDLASEYQLLKEVDHPNVIKLLGVCSQKGPLYLIVEYCELGSLRSFLRACKLKNKCSWEDKQRLAVDQGSDSPQGQVITNRDFFSFAWQIAKGMDYLSGLKIVHRDLAARNVLVSEGLKLKISDFGLSRDVYEMNIYLKLSKGRIPVKWMAPESLYGQVYTTKSDIWSYGIVLWETVTLGASPYPGIPPESLFPLLNTGYRMDRPEDCPDELYAIMQKCWKSEPEQRPTFSTLVSTLDNILQQNIVYLDLAGENYLSPGSDFGLESNKVTSPATFPAAQLPVTADDNQQNKPYNNLDGKVNQYKNLQSPDSNISSSLDLERDSLLEEKSKLIEESSCDEEVDKSQLEVEKDVPEESCLLLTPSQDKEMKDQEKIIGLGNSALTPHRYAKDPTASLHKTEGNPSRPRVHENPIYV